MFDLLINSVSYVVPFAILISIVAFFHELGHFLVGRWCGVKVNVFSIGFGPELYARTDRYGTRWRIAAIPLGGYVKFHGDTNDVDPQADMSAAFAAQPASRRAAIVLAGPLANFVLAIAILAGSFYFHGHGVVGPRIGGVLDGSVAAEAGFRAGDLVRSINGAPVSSFAQIMEAAAVDAPLDFVVRRGEQDLKLTATPSLREIAGPGGKQRVRLGVFSSADPGNFHKEAYGAAESLRLAVSSTWQMTRTTGSYLARLVSGRESGDQLSGPIGIAQISHDSAQETRERGLVPFLNLIAMFSVSVGLFNLLPIPLLDGGHLAQFAIESVIGRPISHRLQELGLRAGLAMVSMVLIFSTYNDLTRLIR